VPAARRSFGNGVGVERMDSKVRRDDARANNRPGFAPGLPADGERIPSLGALLREHLINEVADVDQVTRIVEGVALVVGIFGDVRAFGRSNR